MERCGEGGGVALPGRAIKHTSGKRQTTNDERKQNGNYDKKFGSIQSWTVIKMELGHQIM